MDVGVRWSVCCRTYTVRFRSGFSIFHTNLHCIVLSAFALDAFIVQIQPPPLPFIHLSLATLSTFFSCTLESCKVVVVLPRPLALVCHPTYFFFTISGLLLYVTSRRRRQRKGNKGWLPTLYKLRDTILVGIQLQLTQRTKQLLPNRRSGQRLNADLNRHERHASL